MFSARERFFLIRFTGSFQCRLTSNGIIPTFKCHTAIHIKTINGSVTINRKTLLRIPVGGHSWYRVLIAACSTIWNPSWNSGNRPYSKRIARMCACHWQDMNSYAWKFPGRTYGSASLNGLHTIPASQGSGCSGSRNMQTISLSGNCECRKLKN